MRLSEEFGAGFDVSNLRNMRRFYLAFPIRETLSLELNWSAYLCLIRVDNPKARVWYAKEAAEQGWSVRALDRQISTLYYERLLSTQDKAKTQVKDEAAQNIQELYKSALDAMRSYSGMEPEAITEDFDD